MRQPTDSELDELKGKYVVIFPVNGKAMRGTLLRYTADIVTIEGERRGDGPTRVERTNIVAYACPEHAT